MTKTNDQPQSRIAQLNAFLAANPTAQAWVEEALIRGKPGDGPGWGGIRGAHFTIGLRLPDPFGQVQQQIVGPFSASDVPDDKSTPIGELIGQVVIQQQRQIDEQAATLAANDKQIQQLTQGGQAKDAQIAGLTSQLATAAEAGAAKDERIATLQEQLTAAQASVKTLTQQVADLTSQYDAASAKLQVAG